MGNPKSVVKHGHILRSTSQFSKHQNDREIVMTNQLKEFKEVYVGVKHVLDVLQPLLGKSTHGIPDPIQPSAAGEDDESL